MTKDVQVAASDLAAQMQAAIHPVGEPTDEELALINQEHALKPLSKNDVYVFRLEISNDLDDSYHTRMDPDTTLRNYVQDFKQGRSIQNSHNTDELPLGRSFDAALEQRGAAGDADDPMRTSAVLKGYIPRGLKLGAVASDDVIRGLDTGVIKDGSVHFDDEARYVCSLCGNDMYERESSCPHLPGLTYGGKRAKALIVDGHALEASLCYDGATPMAMVDKAMRLAAAGRLSEKAVARIERRYRTRIRAAAAPTAGGAPRVPNVPLEPDLDDQPGVPKGNDDADADNRAKGEGMSSHESFTGTHSHSHPAFAAQGGDESHEHEHTHSGDADHGHAHEDRQPPATADRSYLDLVPAHVRAAVLFMGAEKVERAVMGSYEDTQRILTDAIQKLYPASDSWVWTVATTDKDVAYEVHGNDSPGTYQVTYEIDADGVVTLGKPKPVVITQVVKAVPEDRAARGKSVRKWADATPQERATWTTSYVNDLPDSAFAYIEAGGEKDDDGRTTPRSLRHFPHHGDDGEPDKAHVQNALGRIPQSDVSDTAKASALAHIKSHAKALGIEVEDGSSKKKSKKKSAGGAMKLNPDTFASLAGVAFPSAEERTKMVDAIAATAPEEVTPDFVTRVAAAIVKRAGPAISADVASQVQGILDKMSDASDAHQEAIDDLKSLVGMGAEGGLQYGLPDNMASIEDLEPGQAAANGTLQYGADTTPGSGSNGSQPASGSIGGGRGQRSIQMGAIPLADAVKSSLTQIVGIIDDLMKTDAQEDEQDVEQQAAEDARPISSEAIPIGRSQEDIEARVVRVQEFERAIRLVPDLAPIRKLVDQARAGARYRKVLVKEYLEWGVRARGTDFNSALHQRLLPAMDLDAIEEMTRDFETQAYKRFANADPEEKPEWLPSLAAKIGRQTTPGLLPGTPSRGNGRTKGVNPVEAARAAREVELYSTK